MHYDAEYMAKYFDEKALEYFMYRGFICDYIHETLLLALDYGSSSPSPHSKNHNTKADNYQTNNHNLLKG